MAKCKALTGSAMKGLILVQNCWSHLIMYLPIVTVLELCTVWKCGDTTSHPYLAIVLLPIGNFTSVIVLFAELDVFVH